MGLLRIPNDVEHAMFTHPINEPLHGKDLSGTIRDLRVSNYRIKLLDAEDTALQQL